MKNLLVFCAVIWTVLLHTSNVASEMIQDNTTVVRQPRYSRQEEPILLIRPVSRDSPIMRLPINRKHNPIPMSPMMGNGFLIRTKTAGGDDNESVVKEFISHFGHVVTRIDHGNSRKVEPPKYISLPPNVNYFIKSIQSPQPMKKFSSQSNLVYRYPPPNVVHQRPAGFLKKRNIKSESLHQMTPQFRASPQVSFEESANSLKTSLAESAPVSDDWTPTSSIASPALMHAIENNQYQNQQFIKSKREKIAFTQHLMDDFTLPNSEPAQSSFSSMTIKVADDKIPSFKPKVSFRVAAEEKIKNRTRLKPVREFHDEESEKAHNVNENVEDQNGEEDMERKFESDHTPPPLFVTPFEVTTTKTTKLYKHRSSLKHLDSCESTCLMNIVNLDYDPLCGSNDVTYMNVGRFRCTKICGQLQLTIKHFGSCEDKKAMKVL